MPIQTQTNLKTLQDVLNFIAPFAGGSIPNESDQEYADWINWVINKQEEYAKRAFWRRCLTREEDTILGETFVLPDRFNRPNALYAFIVDNEDWLEPNSLNQKIFVEMINDIEDEDYGKWQIRFSIPVEETKNVVMWYFANPPTPSNLNDILLLPGDMIGYAVLAEYYRTTGAEGSMDKAEQDAENRFIEYLSLEAIPSKNELMVFTSNPRKTDYLKKARGYYKVRSGRMR